MREKSERFLLAGVTLIGVAIWTSSEPLTRMLFWDRGVLTVDSCRNYHEFSLGSRNAPDVAEVNGTLEEKNGKKRLFYGQGVQLPVCPQPGTVLNVDYSPDELNKAQPPVRSAALLASLFLALVGLGLIAWPSLRPGPKDAPPPPEAKQGPERT